MILDLNKLQKQCIMEDELEPTDSFRTSKIFKYIHLCRYLKNELNITKPYEEIKEYENTAIGNMHVNINKDAVSEYDPNYEYSGITINMNYKCFTCGNYDSFSFAVYPYLELYLNDDYDFEEYLFELKFKDQLDKWIFNDIVIPDNYNVNFIIDIVDRIISSVNLTEQHKNLLDIYVDDNINIPYNELLKMKENGELFENLEPHYFG